jgi:hypothetical protein
MIPDAIPFDKLLSVAYWPVLAAEGGNTPISRR